MNLNEKIHNALRAGDINEYMARKLLNTLGSGVNEQLLDDALDDARSASKLGVDKDKDYRVYFFITNLGDDLLKDTFDITLSDEDLPNLCQHALNEARDKDYQCDNLTDFRLLLYDWLRSKHHKKAYPNIDGKYIGEPHIDLNKWTMTAKLIYDLITKQHINRDEALKVATDEWDIDEIFKFNNWLRYYENNNTERYRVKTAMELNLPENLLNPENRSSRLPDVLDRARQQQNEKEQREQVKRDTAHLYKIQMKSRLRALKKLLDRYNDILPHQDLDRIQNEMFALDKSINKLNINASIQDRIILSANRIEKLGFKDGATLLMKFAADPANPPSAIGDDVVEAIPPSTDSGHPESKQFDVGSITIQTIVHRLEAVSKRLKSRETIRELASIDILLNELGMASLFSEITDSQSKLIEAYGYASNKVESVAAKLRGSGSIKSLEPQNPTAPKPPVAEQQQKMEAEQLRTKPVGPVEKKLPTG